MWKCGVYEKVEGEFVKISSVVLWEDDKHRQIEFLMEQDFNAYPVDTAIDLEGEVYAATIDFYNDECEFDCLGWRFESLFGTEFQVRIEDMEW